jgi:hypothetical protein
MEAHYLAWRLMLVHKLQSVIYHCIIEVKKYYTFNIKDVKRHIYNGEK